MISFAESVLVKCLLMDDAVQGNLDLLAKGNHINQTISTSFLLRDIKDLLNLSRHR